MSSDGGTTVTSQSAVPNDVVAEVLSNALLFFLMFGLSATVKFENLVNQLSNKYAIATGIGMQFLVMPVLGFVAVQSFEQISPAVGITLLVVTSSPGGSYSNWWCSLFNADLALSVAMTALSTVLSTFLLPANLMLYAHITYGDDKMLMQSVDWKTLFITLVVVLSAIFLGLSASYCFRSKMFRRWANRFGTLSGLLLVLVSVFLSSQSTETALWNQPVSFYLAVAFPCCVGLVLANLLAGLARLKKPEQVTVSVECCYQNVGIATSVAVAMFNDRNKRGEALCVPMFYGLVEAILLAFYCLAAWKAGWTKAPKDEKLCVTIATSYEVGPDENSTNHILPEKGAQNVDTTLHDESISFDNTTYDNSSTCDNSQSGSRRIRLDTEEEVAHPSSVPGRPLLVTEMESGRPLSPPTDKLSEVKVL